MSTALPTRLRTELGSRLRAALLGRDPDARREHLRVAAALGIAVAAGTAVLRLSGVVVSPVVWDVLLAGTVLTLVGLPVVNAYWGGGLLVGWLLVFVPVAVGLTVAVAGHGPFENPVRTVTVGGGLLGLGAFLVAAVGYLLGRILGWVAARRGGGA